MRKNKHKKANQNTQFNLKIDKTQKLLVGRNNQIRWKS